MPRLPFALLAIGALAGCEALVNPDDIAWRDASRASDAGRPGLDAARPSLDAAEPGLDAAAPGPDAGFDRCGKNDDGCDPNAACTLVPGGKDCACFQGFTTPADAALCPLDAGFVCCDPLGLEEGAPWPMRGAGPRHVGRSRYTATKRGTAYRHLDWVGPVSANLAIGANGTIFVGGMAATQAVDATGTPTGPRWKTMGNLFTTPAIGADGTVYVGNGVDGLLAFSPDGGIEWTHSTGPVYASPAVGPDGTVYIGVSPTIPVDGGVYGRVEAINPGDGGTIWSCELPTAKEVHSSPAIGADGTLYIGCDEGVLYAVVEALCDAGPCGTVKWSYNAGGVLSSSPAIGADGTIYVGSKAPSSGLHAIEPKKGKRFWRLSEVGSLHSSPAIGPDGTVYVGSNDNRLYAVDPSSSCDAGPCIKWSVNSNGAVRSSPAVGADGVIYLLMAASPNVYSMQALSPNGGGLVWEQATNDSYGYSSPAIGADGTVWVGTQTAPDSGTVSGGSLFSFRP